MIPFTEKDFMTLFFNSRHTLAGDNFFYYYTQLPEVALIVFVCIYAFFRKIKWFTASVAAFSIGGLLVGISKLWLFNGYPRPFASIKAPKVLHIVEGMIIHSTNSFPSGHTLSAFVGLSLLAYMTTNNSVKTLCFILACMVAVSRMYLGQHFFVDVYAGAIIGYGIASLTFIFFTRFFTTPFWERPALKI
ncbi:MAG: phosphatase PAP2 family protein [Bacteroidia bacterium]|nr:phosphatase PAP2 family protein [Bacteroidia bacterium]